MNLQAIIVFSPMLYFTQHCYNWSLFPRWHVYHSYWKLFSISFRARDDYLQSLAPERRNHLICIRPFWNQQIYLPRLDHLTHQKFTEFCKGFIPRLLKGIKVRVFFGKNIEKKHCAVMIRISITFANQEFL